MSRRALVQSRLPKGYGALGFKVTDYSEYTRKQESVKASWCS